LAAICFPDKNHSLVPLKTKSLRRAKSATCRLTAPGWNARTRAALEKLIRQGAGKRLPVVFDFDNTIIHGDIGEATFGVLARSGKFSPSRLPAALAPAFRSAGKGRVALADSAGAVEYYEALLSPTVHGENDPAPLTTGYTWVVEIMAGLRLSEVIAATDEVCQLSEKRPPGFITVTPGKTGFPVPTFYPEMVELLAQLLRHEFDVWIVSASNVWSVRWMVLNFLNPRLHDCGAVRGIAADHVIGMATLLADDEDRLYKDSVLVRECSDYAAMKSPAMSRFHLTRHLQFPVPAYSGKVAGIFDAIGRQPYFCAGDGPGDHAMLAISQHRLWIDRVEKPHSQPATARLIQRTGETSWMIQAASAAVAPRFLNHVHAGLAQGSSHQPNLVAASPSLLKVSAPPKQAIGKPACVMA
jgi:hypothetical protein